MSEPRAERPNTLPWPPMIYGGALLLGSMLQVFVPWHLDPGALGRACGVILLAGGLALDLWTLSVFRRAGTTVMPHRGASRLVTGGPFRLSRNPIYLGNTIALIGAGLAFGAPWLAVLAIPAAVLVDILAIRREERHLAARFGAEWEAYAGRVRRWI